MNIRSLFIVALITAASAQGMQLPNNAQNQGPQQMKMNPASIDKAALRIKENRAKKWKELKRYPQNCCHVCLCGCLMTVGGCVESCKDLCNVMKESEDNTPKTQAIGNLCINSLLIPITPLLAIIYSSAECIDNICCKEEPKRWWGSHDDGSGIDRY